MELNLRRIRWPSWLRRSPHSRIRDRVRSAFDAAREASSRMYEANLLAQEHGLGSVQARLSRTHDEVDAAVQSLRDCEECIALEWER